MAVNLPEDGGAGPVSGGTYKIGVDELGDVGGIEDGFEEGDEVVVFVIGEGGLEGGFRDEGCRMWDIGFLMWEFGFKQLTPCLSLR